MNKPILLETYGNDVFRIMPDFRREIHDTGYPYENICQFPDAQNAIMTYLEEIERIGSTIYVRPHYIDFEFQNESSREIELPYNPKDFITDTENNQIIGLGLDYLYIDETNYTANYIVQFISPDFSSESWVSPEDLKLFKGGKFIFDQANSILWVYYTNKESGDIYFNKLSTSTKTLLNSFIIKGGTFEFILKIVTDPCDKFLYFIDETNTNSKRELAIFDLNKKEITKRIVLQESVVNGYVTRIVIPGIIPVPEKDKLFLWDHYGSWCIDTNSMEILYGRGTKQPSG